MANAKELAFTQDEMLAIKNVLECPAQDNDAFERAIDIVANRIEARGNERMKTFVGGLSLVELVMLDDSKRKDILKGILLAFRGGSAARPVDLSSIGGAKNAFRLRPARNALPEDFYIIDQSVTGMFERRTRVGL